MHFTKTLPNIIFHIIYIIHKNFIQALFEIRMFDVMVYKLALTFQVLASKFYVRYKKKLIHIYSTYH